MEKCFKLNAAKKFFDILSGSEFVAFLGYGNEVEATLVMFLTLQLELHELSIIDNQHLYLPGQRTKITTHQIISAGSHSIKLMT